MDVFVCLQCRLDTQAHADAAARAIRVTYKSHGKPIVTLEQAIKAGSLFHDDQAKAIKKGDAAGK